MEKKMELLDLFQETLRELPFRGRIVPTTRYIHRSDQRVRTRAAGREGAPFFIDLVRVNGLPFPLMLHSADPRR
jgi:hypothetical protein